MTATTKIATTITCSLLTILIICCATTDTPNKTVRYYSDINMFNLSGIGEIQPSELQYPYIEVDSINERQRKIFFHYDESTGYKCNYDKKDSFWCSLHITRNEGRESYFFDFLSDSQIISLEYIGDPKKNGSLVTLRVLERGKEITYDFDEDVVKIQPSANIDNYPLDKIFKKEITKYYIHNGILKIESNYSYTAEHTPGGSKTECYPIGHLSYFWWAYAGFKIEKMECS